MAKRISIVGAGVGGLATAARLAKAGHEVSVYEKLSECGGRAHMIEDQGFKFDTGPSFVLMPDFFQEVFSSCGENIEDHLDLKTLDQSYKIFYSDGRVLTVHKDSEKTKEELEKLEPGSAIGFDKFINETGKIYDAVKPLLYQCFTPKSLFNPKYFSLAFKLNLSKTYWQLARKFFKSDELCYAFTFEAMFIGVSPFNCPGFYSVITYVDHVQKISYPIGGMYEIPKALAKMAEGFGAKIHYNSEIKKVIPGKDNVVLTLGNDEVASDQAVINADYAYTQRKLLSRKLPKFKYSCSVYLLYLGLKQKVQGLEHHNLIFAKDLNKNLRDVFDKKIVSEDFSFYIHVPTVTDPSLAPEGKDIMYILVPTANLDNFQDDFKDKEEGLRRTLFNRINKLLGIDLEELIEVEHRFYPEDFIKRYNIEYGATFGLAHSYMQSAFFRPANFDSQFKNLFYVGASTQPGGGLPPVLASSKIISDLINRK